MSDPPLLAERIDCSILVRTEPTKVHDAFATPVRIELAPAPEGTVVHLTETGYRDTPAGRERRLECASGRGEALALWKFSVEHGVRY